MKLKRTLLPLILIVLCSGTNLWAKQFSTKAQLQIVSLKPNITQTLIDLGIGDWVSGVTTFCPKPNNQMEIVADYTSVDLEKLARLQPDIIFTSKENAQSRQFEMMERVVPKIVLLDFNTFEAMKKSMVRIGQELEIEEKTKYLVRQMSDSVRRVRQEIDEHPTNKKTFAAIVQHKPIMVAAGQTFLSTLLEEVGFKNVFGDDQVHYPQISEEGLIEKNPAIVFDFVHEGNADDLCRGTRVCAPTMQIIRLPIEDYLAAPSSVERLANLDLHGLTQTNTDGTRTGYGNGNVFLNLSLPRFVLAFLVGLALSVCGLSFQSLLKNPLADPYILGISGGAALGYVAGVVAHVPVMFTPVMGFVGGLLSLLIIYRLACRSGVLSVTNLLLMGIVFNAFSFALILVINSVVNFGQAHQILYLLLGAVEPLPWSRLCLTAIVVCIVSTVLCLRAGRLNILSLGDEEAFHLGLDVNYEKKVIFVLSSLLVGITVSLCGLIGFVGLIVPHIARLIVGADNRRALPVAAVIGGLLLCGCEYLAGHIFAFDTLMTRLPVGAVTALIGAPVFVLLVKRET